MDAERIFRDRRFFQVRVPNREPGLVPAVKRALGLERGRLIRQRMTEEEAQDFLDRAREFPGQEEAEVTSIFD